MYINNIKQASVCSLAKRTPTHQSTSNVIL